MGNFRRFGCAPLLLGVLACVEVDSTPFPALPDSTRAVLIIARESSGAMSARALSRPSLGEHTLSPVRARASGPVPELWIEFHDRSLEMLGLSEGELPLTDAGECGARVLPRAEFQYELQRSGDTFVFAAVSSGLRPDLYVREPCVCTPGPPPARVVQLEGICGAEMSARREGLVSFTGHRRRSCDDSPASGRTAQLFDPRSLELTETTTSIPHVRTVFSFDGVVTYWGSIDGSLHRATGDGQHELVFAPTMPAGEIRAITGGLVDGALELILVLDEPEEGDRGTGAILYRYRERDGAAELIYTPDPSSFQGRQATVALWIDEHRAVVFPEDDQSWYDVRGSEVTKHLWPPARLAVRSGTMLPEGVALVGTLSGGFFVLDGTDFVESARFSTPALDEVRAIVPLRSQETWYFAGEDQLGREIGGTSCPPIELPERIRAVSMLALGDHVVILGERLDETGSVFMVLDRP